MTRHPACICDHPLPAGLADALCETCQGADPLARAFAEGQENPRLLAETDDAPTVPAP